MQNISQQMGYSLIPPSLSISTVRKDHNRNERDWLGERFRLLNQRRHRWNPNRDWTVRSMFPTTMQ